MKKLVIAFLMVTTMLHWPNMIFHYNSFIVTYIKPMFIISSIVVFAFLGQKKITAFLGYLAIMLAVCVNYSWVNGLYYNAYFFRAFFFISMCALFYRHPILIRQYLKIGIFISALLGLQAFILTILMLGEVTIGYDNIVFIDGGEKEFNWLAGFRNDPNYFRVISYFTETNRLAYFLTPSLFVSYYYAKSSLLFKGAFLVILFGVVSTFSVFSFFAIIVGVSFYMVYAKRKGLQYLLIAPVGALFIMGIYFLFPEYLASVTDKTGSTVYRLLGIIAKVEMITSNPFGAGEVALAKSLELTPEANSTLTMLYWGVVGGVQSIVLLLILLVSWSFSILKLSRLKDGYLCLLACGMLASVMQQSFYGTYFEYYFLSMMAVVTASARSYRRSLKSAGFA